MRQSPQPRYTPPPPPPNTPAETTTLVLEGTLGCARQNQQMLVELLQRLGVPLMSGEATATAAEAMQPTVNGFALEIRNTQIRMSEMLAAALGQV